MSGFPALMPQWQQFCHPIIAEICTNIVQISGEKLPPTCYLMMDAGPIVMGGNWFCQVNFAGRRS